MSESAMFRDPATPFPHDGKIGFGAVATHATARGAIEEVRSRDQRASQNENTFISTRSYGVYLSAFDPKGRYAFSFTAGFPFGFDATRQLWKRNYLTAAVSITGVEGTPPLGQVYLQHRAFNSPFVAAAIGVGARHELLSYSTPSENVFGGIQEVRVASIGVRGFAILRGGRGRRSGFKLGGYVGYMPNLHEAIIGATLTLGSY